MTMRLLIGLMMLPLLGVQEAGDKVPVTISDDQEGEVRFEPVQVYLDSGDAPLAAYQLTLASRTDNVRIVGIEGGEHEAYAEPPYYDPIAMRRDEVILADFSLAPAERLPRGRILIATIHVHITGEEEPRFEITLQVAATVEGQPIEVAIEHTRGAE